MMRFLYLAVIFTFTALQIANAETLTPINAKAKVGGVQSPDGKELMTIQLPGKYHQQNTGGSDGQGLCVYASAKHTGIWQHDALFTAMFDYMRTQPGGSWPDKFDATLKAASAKLGMTVPEYIHVEGTDIEILKTAVKNGFLPGVTYGYSPTGRYGRKIIGHMVSLPHASDSWFAVLDNNYPGETKYEWMPSAEFAKVHSANGGSGWSVILLIDPPPPAPRR